MRTRLCARQALLQDRDQSINKGILNRVNFRRGELPKEVLPESCAV